MKPEPVWPDSNTSEVTDAVPGHWAEAFESGSNRNQNADKEIISAAENHLVSLIYSYASAPEDWFQLLQGLSQCMSWQADENALGITGADLGRRLLPHFTEAIRICAELSEKRTDYGWALDNFSRMNFAAGILSESGILQDTTPDLARFLERSEIVRKTDDRLSVRFSDGWHTLTSEFLSGEKNAAQYTLENGYMAVQSLGSDGGFLVLISASGASMISDETAQFFGLSVAERKVAELVFSDQSAERIADSLGIKPLTVRDHLSSIYKKTGVSRKPELVQRLCACGLFNFSETSHQKDLLSSRYNNQGGADECETDSEISLPPLSRPRYIMLDDGRRLSFFLHGQPGGKTVFVCHNLMGAGRELPETALSQAAAQGLQVVIPERPGYGDSSPHPKRTHMSWCQDLQALCDELGVTQFSLVGHSIGAAYALAAAEQFSDRVEKVLLVSPMCRFQDMMASPPVPLSLRTSMLCVKYAPFMIRPMFQLMLRDDVAQFYDQRPRLFTPEAGKDLDAEARLQRIREKPYYVANLQRSLMQGVDAWVDEMLVSFKPWNFELNQSIKTHIWHGEKDDQIPLRLVEATARNVNCPGVQVIPDEIHGFFMRYAEQVLDFIADDQSRDASSVA